MTDYISREAARPDAFCEGISCQECPFCKDFVFDLKAAHDRAEAYRQQKLIQSAPMLNIKLSEDDINGIMSTIMNMQEMGELL